jgi:S1-C subfamily serine protease
VLTEVDRQPISGVADFKKAINSLAEQEKDIVLLRVLAGEASQLIAFEL